MVPNRPLLRTTCPSRSLKEKLLPAGPGARVSVDAGEKFKVAYALFHERPLWIYEGVTPFVEPFLPRTVSPGECQPWIFHNPWRLIRS